MHLFYITRVRAYRSDNTHPYGCSVGSKTYAFQTLRSCCRVRSAVTSFPRVPCTGGRYWFLNRRRFDLSNPVPPPPISELTQKPLRNFPLVRHDSGLSRGRTRVLSSYWQPNARLQRKNILFFPFSETRFFRKRFRPFRFRQHAVNVMWCGESNSTHE